MTATPRHELLRLLTQDSYPTLSSSLISCSLALHNSTSSKVGCSLYRVILVSAFYPES